MIHKFFFFALNSKIDWTLQSLSTEITNKSMEKYNLYPQPEGPTQDHIDKKNVQL